MTFYSITLSITEWLSLRLSHMLHDIINYIMFILDMKTQVLNKDLSTHCFLLHVNAYCLPLRIYPTPKLLNFSPCPTGQREQESTPRSQFQLSMTWFFPSLCPRIVSVLLTFYTTLNEPLEVSLLFVSFFCFFFQCELGLTQRCLYFTPFQSSTCFIQSITFLSQ